MNEQNKPQILVVDDVLGNLQVLSNMLEPQGYDVLIANRGKDALQTAAQVLPDMILLDVMMPGIDGFEVCQRLKADEKTRHIPVIFLTAAREKDSLVHGFGAGGVDYISKPFQSEEVLVRLKTHLQINRLTQLLVDQNQTLAKANQELEQSYQNLKEAVAQKERAEAAQERSAGRLQQLSEQDEHWWGTERMCGESETLQKILTEVAQLQATHTTSVLIMGESGTGKELVARAIHFGGTRAKGPFIPVNCAAIPADLVEASFFGHVRGAFTGAEQNRQGFFEQADGGTLFLDEVEDMPLALQAKLLRVLEDGMVLPVGGHEQKRVNVRVLAATNADLQTKVAAREFRQDLYYRLAVVTVNVPPLRERKEDLPLLADHFLSLFARDMGVSAAELSREALQQLEGHDFPGNVRELKNMIEYALIKSGGKTVLPQHLPNTNATVASEGVLNDAAVAAPNRGTEEEHVLAYLQKNASIGNTECRELLGVSRRRTTGLLNRMCKEGLLKQIGSRRWTRYRLASQT